MKKLISITVLSLGFLCGCGDRGTKVGEYFPGNHYIPTGTKIVSAYGQSQLYGVIVEDEEGNYYDVRFSTGDVTKLKFMDYANIENTEENSNRKWRRSRR